MLYGEDQPWTPFASNNENTPDDHRGADTFRLYGLDVVEVDLVPRAFVSLALFSPRHNGIEVWFQPYLRRLVSGPKAKREGSSLESIA